MKLGVSTKRLLFLLTTSLLSVVLCLLAAELLARAFWLQRGVPFTDPGRILYAYYPELRDVDTARPQPSHGGKFYDILFLGGSVLNRQWGEVEQALLEQLSRKGYRNVRVFNLAMPAHTSRDSWLKYAALSKARFELVVLYDGINETRANNAPPEIFQKNYAHYSWYEVTNALASYHGVAYFALPYTLRYIAIGLRQALYANRYVATEYPRDEWVQYGSDPRSAASFKQNLGRIVKLATRRGDQLLLMTFAAYIPPDPLWGMGGRRFGLRLAPVTMWGRREHVLNAIAAQNEVVRSLVAEHDDILFVDQEKLMERSARNFNDPCHLTIEGSLQFVTNLLGALGPDQNAVRAR